MNKVVRIFLKDVRHLWPEILCVLVLTTGFALTQKFAWPMYREQAFPESNTLLVWMMILLPFSWWILLSRAVHDEPLVGDRQFWVTRPYGTTRVLAEKWVFLVSFLLVPYACAMLWLLHVARFHPFAFLQGVVVQILFFGLFLLLPLFALASVTSSLTRVFFSFIGLGIFVGFTIYFNGLANSKIWSPGEPSMGIFWLLPLVCAVIVAVQYFHRRTRLSIGLYIAVVLVITVGLLVQAHTSRTDSSYPRLSAAQAAPFLLSLNPDPGLRRISPDSAEPVNDLHIPLLFKKNVASGHLLSIDGVKVSIDSQDGKRGVLGWRHNLLGNQDVSPNMESLLNRNDEAFFAEEQKETLGVVLPREVLSSGPSLLTLHLVLAVTEFIPQDSSRIVPVPDGFRIPENGYCESDRPFSGRDSKYNCQFAFAGHSLLLASWPTYVYCDANSGPAREKRAWLRARPSSGPTYLSMDPIETDELDFYRDYPTENFRICPGAAITFTQFRTVHYQVEVTLPPIDPSAYDARSFTVNEINKLGIGRQQENNAAQPSTGPAVPETQGSQGASGDPGVSGAKGHPSPKAP